MGEMGGGRREGIFFPVIPFYIICKFLYRTLCYKNFEIAKTQQQKQHQQNHQTTKNHQNQQTTTKTKATEHQDYRGGEDCLHFISFVFCKDCEQAKAPLKRMLEKTLERTLLASLKFLPSPLN